jgi:excisionase family DNA binding protein
MDAQQLYLNVNEVSHLLGVSAKTVIRWSLESRLMPVLRRGRVVRFPRQRLLAWLEAQEPAQGQHKAARSIDK